MAKPVLSVDVDFAANPTASYADIHTNDDGVVSFWRANSTSTFLDTLGVNDGVQISTGTLTAGPYTYDTDQGLTYDGANDSSYVVSSASLSLNTQFSVDGWIKVAALPAGTRDLVAKRGSWLLQLTAAGKLLWTVKDDTSTATVTSGTTIQTNTYYHVTGVYSDTEILLYVNGVLDGSSAYSSGAELGSQPIRWAATPSTASPTFQSSTTATGSSTSITGTTPASTGSGDLLIAHFYGHSGGSGSSVTASPTDWLLLATETPVTGGAGSQCQLWYKIAGGSEPANYTWTVDNSIGWGIAITRITGQHALFPFANVPYSAVFTSSTTTKPTGSHLPAVDNNMVLAFFATRGNATWTEDSGTERYDFPNSGTTTAIAMCSQTQASAASLNVTGTSSVSQVGAAMMLVLCGAAETEVACTLDDWTYWNRGLDADDVRRNYESRKGGTPVWSTVASNLREGEFRSASRQYELDRLEAGTGSAVLNNPNFNYDPANTSSIYATTSTVAGVVPMRRIRARAAHTVGGSTTTYNICHQYVERWPTGLATPVLGEVRITTVDGFDLLAQAGASGTLEVALSGAQIHELLDKALWPDADRAIDDGQYVMEPQTIADGTAALGIIQEVADSERGLFFIDAAGIATFHDAAHRGTQTRSTTSQATFVDSADAAGIGYQEITPSFDRDRIVNDWTVSPGTSVPGGTPQRVVDWVSVAKYGLRSRSRSTHLATTAYALSQAGNLLNETAEPGLRFDTMTVKATTDLAFQKCLDLRISDRVTVKTGTLSEWTGPRITRDCFVESKVLALVGQNEWVFTFQLSPVSSGNYYMTIMRDDPISYWRLDAIT